LSPKKNWNLERKIPEGTMATFILIPGGWQGGWAFDKVATLLTAQGHKAHPITLSGLGDVPAPTANLETHISEAISAVRAHDDDLVVVGHSYGGMVVSGAADAEPSRIRALVYVDAYVPETGDSVWSLTTARFRDAFAAGARADGLNCMPMSGMDQRCRPHPIGTFLQSIDLGGRWREIPRKAFVGAHGWEGSPFRNLYQRLSEDPEWMTFALDCGHNVARLQPEALTEILLAQT
jgi:pimeloyl-ACP methyl ester carboxylesterase